MPPDLISDFSWDFLRLDQKQITWKVRAGGQENTLRARQIREEISPIASWPRSEKTFGLSSNDRGDFHPEFEWDWLEDDWFLPSICLDQSKCKSNLLINSAFGRISP